MKKSTITQSQFNILSWGLVAASIMAVTFAWGDLLGWEVGSLSPYQWFPLFGMIAWTVMATHYYLGALRLMQPGLSRPPYFKQITGYIVLGALLLHPGILAIAQFQNGEGLPPSSYLAYVGDSMRLAVMLGSVSLLTFLSFEILERLKSNKTIDKNWKYVSLAQAVAMGFIWFHAVKLGSHVSSGWVYWMWVVYGLALLPSFFVVLKQDFKSSTLS